MKAIILILGPNMPTTRTLRCSVVVSVADPVRKVSWILFQEGQSSELRLRQGVAQVAHTLSIIPK